VKRQEAAMVNMTKNGPALAAFLAAGLGSLALGALVLLNEAGIYAAPTLYAPAGGLSGRTTIATLVWLVAWAVLHYVWRDRDLDPRAIHTVTLMMVLLAIAATFPPLWALL